MYLRKNILCVGAGALFAILTSSVYASSFQVAEINASGLGDAYAGGAAIAEDASTNYDNPAGLVRLDRMEFTAAIAAVPGHAHVTSTEPIIHGAANPMGTTFVPSMYFATPIVDKLHFGLGVSVPFGQLSDYERDPVFSGFATKSKIETINLNPNLAYKITDELSVGAGFDVQYLRAELNTLALEQHASDWGCGWNAGVMYQFDKATRMGLAYRSHITHNPTGTANVAKIGPFPAKTISVRANATLPEMASLSFYHDYTQNLAAMATIAYTRWATLDNLTFNYSQPIIPSIPSSNMIVEPQGNRNVFRFALGGNYRINDNWMWRVGTAYDRSPITDDNRQLSLPDGNRIWLATGVQYIYSKHIAVDAGYAHVFIQSGTITQHSPLDPHSYVKANVDHSYADIVGVQMDVKL